MRVSFVAVALIAAIALPPISVAADPVSRVGHVPGRHAGATVDVRDGGARVTRTVPGLAALGTDFSLADVAAAWRSELRWLGGDEASVVSDGPEESRPWGWVSGVGDLDGDGRRDIVTVRTAAETMTFRGVKGSTGKVLWRHTEPGVDGHAMVATVGPDHERGVLLLSVAFEMTEEADGSATMTSATSITALSGSGGVLWRRSFEGSGTMSDMGAVIQGMAYPVGVGRLNDDAATDVLVASTDLAAGPIGGAERTQLLVLDGATGDTTMTTETPSAGGFSSVGVVGDIDGDTLQDVVVASGSTAGVSVTAYAGTDGRPLWNSMVDAEFVYGVGRAGDLNGDGVTDLLLAGFDPESFGGTVDAVSGADGAAMWAADGDMAVGVGDVDGDGTDDVIVQRISDNFETGRMGVRYVLRRGDGTKIFSRSHGLRMSEGSSMTSISLYGHVGDASGDRRPDLAHEIQHVAFDDQKTRSNRGVVRSSDGAKTMRGAVGSPLFGKVDRRGDDFAVSRQRAGDLLVRVRDGRTGKELWRRALPAARDSYALATAVNVAGDRRAEVFVTVNGGRIPRIYALNPRTGRLRWKG